MTERTIHLGRGGLGRYCVELGVGEYRERARKGELQGWWVTPEEKARIDRARVARRREWLRKRRAADRQAEPRARAGNRPLPPPNAFEKATAYAEQLLADPLERVVGRTAREVWTLAVEVYELPVGLPMPSSLTAVEGPTRDEVLGELAAARPDNDAFAPEAE